MPDACVYECMYAYVCMHARRACMYICVGIVYAVCVCVCVHMHACMQHTTHAWARYAFICRYVDTYVHMYDCACIHVHACMQRMCKVPGDVRCRPLPSSSTPWTTAVKMLAGNPRCRERTLCGARKQPCTKQGHDPAVRSERERRSLREFERDEETDTEFEAQPCSRGSPWRDGAA